MFQNVYPNQPQPIKFLNENIDKLQIEPKKYRNEKIKKKGESCGIHWSQNHSKGVTFITNPYDENLIVDGKNKNLCSNTWGFSQKQKEVSKNVYEPIPDSYNLNVIVHKDTELYDFGDKLYKLMLKAGLENNAKYIKYWNRTQKRNESNKPKHDEVDEDGVWFTKKEPKGEPINDEFVKEYCNSIIASKQKIKYTDERPQAPGDPTHYPQTIRFKVLVGDSIPDWMQTQIEVLNPDKPITRTPFSGPTTEEWRELEISKNTRLGKIEEWKKKQIEKNFPNPRPLENLDSYLDDEEKNKYIPIEYIVLKFYEVYFMQSQSGISLTAKAILLRDNGGREKSNIVIPTTDAYSKYTPVENTFDAYSKYTPLENTLPPATDGFGQKFPTQDDDDYDNDDTVMGEPEDDKVMKKGDKKPRKYNFTKSSSQNSNGSEKPKSKKRKRKNEDENNGQRKKKKRKTEK